MLFRASSIQDSISETVREWPGGDGGLLLAFALAYARSRDLTPVTGNLAEFQCVPRLVVESWLD